MRLKELASTISESTVEMPGGSRCVGMFQVGVSGGQTTFVQDTFRGSPLPRTFSQHTILGSEAQHVLAPHLPILRRCERCNERRKDTGSLSSLGSAKDSLPAMKGDDK